MTKLQLAEHIAIILMEDELVENDTVTISHTNNLYQVEFYLTCDRDNDHEADLSDETYSKLFDLSPDLNIAMNDCEGCYGEGMVVIS